MNSRGQGAGALDHAARDRVAALDGLRGIAIAAVVLNHARPSALAGGWLGVDIFFVLSGYLITSLLLREHSATGRIDFRHFYSRRARRLLPALFALLIAVAAVARVSPDLPGFADIRGDGAAALAYVANWHLIATGASYFDAFAPSPLRHLWSLAIEEQFYLLWPCALGLLLWRGNRRTVAVVSLVLAAASAIAMAMQFDAGHVSRAYFGTDTHAFSLLIGCAAAAMLSGNRRLPFSRPLGWAAAAGIAIALLKLNGTGSKAYHGGILAVCVLTAVVIASSVERQSGWLAASLGRRPLVGLGRISYGLYLVHWPLILLMTPQRMHVSGWPLVGLQVAASVALATLSFVLIERPVLAGWPRPPASWRAVTAAVATVAVAVAFVAPVVSTPFAAAQEAAAARSAAASPRYTGPALRVMLVGDSVAYSLFPGLEHSEGAGGLYFTNASELGCPLDFHAAVRHHDDKPVETMQLPHSCNWPATWPSEIARARPELVVAFWGLWDLYDEKVGGKWLTVGSAAWSARMRGLVDSSVDILAARGARVVFLTAPYTWGVSAKRTEALNRVLGAAAASRPQVITLVDINPLLARLHPARWDTVHFTEGGADILGKALTPTLGRIAHSNPVR